LHAPRKDRPLRAIVPWVAAAVLCAEAASAKSPCDRPATTILIVRHADRAGKADSLSEAGVARAQDLVRVALRANVRAIYVSDTKRARDTGMPLAAALGIEPEAYPGKETAALIERILKDHPGESVLVVGHSNTVPMIIQAAGGPPMPEIDKKEFDRLFIVHVTPCEEFMATLVELEYGAPSP
jgi:broad specificity phosphatase PhoE